MSDLTTLSIENGVDAWEWCTRKLLSDILREDAMGALNKDELKMLAGAMLESRVAFLRKWEAFCTKRSKEGYAALRNAERSRKPLSVDIQDEKSNFVMRNLDLVPVSNSKDDVEVRVVISTHLSAKEALELVVKLREYYPEINEVLT